MLVRHPAVRYAGHFTRRVFRDRSGYGLTTVRGTGLGFGGTSWLRSTSRTGPAATSQLSKRGRAGLTSAPRGPHTDTTKPFAFWDDTRTRKLLPGAVQVSPTL